MKIQVIREFTSKETGGRIIPPGMYEAGQAALFGLEDTLISEGFALAIEPPPALRKRADKMVSTDDLSED